MSANITDWSTTASSNTTADGDINWAEGQDPNTVNDSARQMMGRIAEFLEDLCGTQTVGGTANAITVTLDSGFTTLANKRIMALRPTADNTGAVTINVNSIGAKAIRKFDRTGDVALASGDLQSGGIYLLVYSTSANSSAGAWVCLNPTQATYQDQSDLLDDIAALAPTDGGFIVGNGTDFVLESGADARTSLGLGTAATTASTAYATAAQGTKADGATQATDLASTANGKGASLIGIEDSGGKITATTVEAALAEIATNVSAKAGFYSGTTANTTDLPVGQILAIINVATTAPSRMGTCTPALHSTDTKKYVLSGDANAGTSLSGTWHSIGYDSGANILWVQRTA